MGNCSGIEGQMNFLTADVAIIVDASKLPQQLAKAERAVKKTAMSMQNSFKRMGVISTRIFTKMTHLAKLAAIAILAAGVASVKFAMDAQESENLFEVSMGNMASAARAWSEELSDTLYLNAYEVRKNIGVFNAMFDSMGLGEKAAYGMATGLTQLAYDMASFYNLKPAEAFQKLQAGITGEAEPLKRLGILLNETTVKQYALNNAIGDGIGNLTELEKVQARYGLILKQTKKAQGDLERTLKSSTNVFRSLWTIIEYTATSIGTELLPMVTEYGLAVRDWLEGSKEEITEWAGVWAEKIEGTIDWFFKWRMEIGYTIAALGGLVIITKITGWILALKAAVWGASIATGAWAASWVTLAGAASVAAKGYTYLGRSFPYLAKQAATEAGLLTLTLARLKSLLPILGKSVLAVGAAMAAWQIGKVVKGLWEYNKAVDNIADTHERLEKVMRRRELERRVGISSLVIEAKKYAEILKAQGVLPSGWEGMTPVPGFDKREEFDALFAEQKIERQNELNQLLVEEIKNRNTLTNTAFENYDVMRSALEFELDHLGEMDELRERAITFAEVEAETQDMLNLSMEERNQKLREYMELFDELQTKQASFTHNIKQWMNLQADWGKALAQIVTGAFNTMGDKLADSLLGMAVDWKAFGRMFIKQIMAMIIKLQILLLFQMLTGTAGGGKGKGALASAPVQPAGQTTFTYPGMAEGGKVTQTGWAKVDKGEVFSGVNNEQGFGGTIVNISDYAGVDIEVNEYKESDQRIVDVTMRAAAGDGSYRRQHKIG
ncbi:hypothetical protein LCGC14_1373780 [marine sediment metagenome]|uniref:Uncharacterized protein n=1 Tax=marine sediment metagenome TaxID=412755 RepID=A0A0F9MJX5_9ZZZZ